MHHGHVSLPGAVLGRHGPFQQHQLPRAEPAAAVHVSRGPRARHPAGGGPPAAAGAAQGTAGRGVLGPQVAAAASGCAGMGARRAAWARLVPGTQVPKGRRSPLPVRQRCPGHPPTGAGSPRLARRPAPRCGSVPGAAGAEQVPRWPEAGWRRFPGVPPLALQGGRGGARTPAVGPGIRAGAYPGAERTWSRGTQVNRRRAPSGARDTNLSGLWGRCGWPQDPRDKARFPGTPPPPLGGHRRGRRARLR